MLMWAKGLKVDLKHNIIISWSQTRLSFNNIKTGMLEYSFKDITAQENHITAVMVVINPFKYFITGTIQGQL